MKNFIEWLMINENLTKEDVIETIKSIHDIILSESDEPDMGKHYGDCIKQNITCRICEYQNWLDGYEIYCRLENKN